ncbi:MAG: hypothetical protein RMX89_29355 [Nostoc sp. DedSLP04]|nr:hypothetical protein [Nostoc sp. DedSLP04]
MKSHKSMTLRQVGIYLGVSSLLTTTILIGDSCNQAWGLELPFLTQFQEVYTSLKSRISSYETEFNQALGQSYGEINAEITRQLNQAVDSTIGSLGIPDPLESGEKIKEVIRSQNPDMTQPNTNTQAENAELSWHGQYTLGQSQSILGVDGQRVQAQEADLTNNALSTSSTNADNAQSDIVTQDILKKMAIQNLQNVVISKAIHGETQKQTRALAAANVNLVDISKNISSQSRKEDAQSRAVAMQLLEAGAYNDAFWERQ